MLYLIKPSSYVCNIGQSTFDMDLFEDTRNWVGTHVLTTITALVLLYTVLGAIYRLYLSPLAKFPGRKLAALTLWYQFYYDYIKRGKYTWEIADMHAKYGT